VGYKARSEFRPPSPGVPFYLNVVGYKASFAQVTVIFIVEFYLNVVGYKARWTGHSSITASRFYLNVVGYKVYLVIDNFSLLGGFI